ncbi:MAG: aminotransferase class V-fold PLP-dependent enzyme [Acidobacteriota bacterium]
MLTAEAPVTGTCFDELREREFSRLDAENHAYLDYTGSALYGISQISAHYALLRSGLFGNPHSDSASSRTSSEVIDRARAQLLRFLDADESVYEVCFTSNTTAAIKLVAESYPFSHEQSLLLSVDNHNSVNGMREYAQRAGARVRYLPLDENLRLDRPEELLEEEGWNGGGLFAFPAQSNFSGVRHPLELVERAQSRGFDVLLDAAAFVPGHVISLRDCPADFVALSFYKLFGYPTGVGALVARRDALARLRRPWFSGGTVTYASVLLDTHRLRRGPEAFEDGTPDFLGLSALDAGFALLDEVQMPRLTAHVTDLTHRFLEEIMPLRHRNGVPLVRLYGPADMRDRGGAITFNLCDRIGQPLPYAFVEKHARESDVSLRGGCFCNPGASEAAFGLDAGQMAACFDELGETFNPERFAACAGRAVGAVRVSFGMANNVEDIRRAVDVVAAFRE